MSEQVIKLIDAIQSGKSLDIESSFNDVMTDKLQHAIEAKRQYISRNLMAPAVDAPVGEEE